MAVIFAGGNRLVIWNVLDLICIWYVSILCGKKEKKGEKKKLKLLNISSQVQNKDRSDGTY